MAKKSQECKEKAAELIAIIKKLEVEDLDFLKQQADVLLHNRTVKEQNQKVLEEFEKNKKTRQKKSGTKKKKDAPIIEIKEDEKFDFFTLFINGTSKTLVRDEMRILTKISHHYESEKEASVEMFNWMENKRKDILLDAGIETKISPALIELIRYLKKTYKVK